MRTIACLGRGLQYIAVNSKTFPHHNCVQRAACTWWSTTFPINSILSDCRTRTPKWSSLVSIHLPALRPQDSAIFHFFRIFTSTPITRLSSRCPPPGISPDRYTVSIMLKALKHSRNPADIKQSLQLLDKSGLDICSDEVLLNTVLDTCIRRREQTRLEQVLQKVMDHKVG